MNYFDILVMIFAFYGAYMMILQTKYKLEHLWKKNKANVLRGMRVVFG